MSASLPERLRALHKKKRLAVEASAKSKSLNADFKQHEARTYAFMEAQEVPSISVAGTLFSAVEKVDGYVEDRDEYIRWALQQDEGIAEFIQSTLLDLVADANASGENHQTWDGPNVVEAFFRALTGTELVTYKEDGTALNAIARAHIDDGAPLPPGVNFRPKSYISQRKS